MSLQSTLNFNNQQGKHVGFGYEEVANLVQIVDFCIQGKMHADMVFAATEYRNVDSHMSIQIHHNHKITIITIIKDLVM